MLSNQWLSIMLYVYIVVSSVSVCMCVCVVTADYYSLETLRMLTLWNVCVYLCNVLYMSELIKKPHEGFSAGLIDDNDIYKWEIYIIGPSDTF